jgi:hypothetical protein
MFDTQILIDFVKKYKGPSPKGISCKFIKFDDNWGIKVYHCERDRNHAFNNQKKMSTYGLAPKTGIVFTIEERYNDNKYCYVTEIVKPIVEGDDDYIEHYNSIIERINRKNPEIIKNIHLLCEAMEIAGYYMSDRHYANFGFTTNGKIVCIDFGL